MQRSFNSFLRFTLGFTLFVALSLGLAFAVSAYSLAQEKEKQAASALAALLNEPEETVWWEFWK